MGRSVSVLQSDVQLDVHNDDEFEDVFYRAPDEDQQVRRQRLAAIVIAACAAAALIVYFAIDFSDDSVSAELTIDDPTTTTAADFSNPPATVVAGPELLSVEAPSTSEAGSTTTADESTDTSEATPTTEATSTSGSSETTNPEANAEATSTSAGPVEGNPGESPAPLVITTGPTTPISAVITSPIAAQTTQPGTATTPPPSQVNPSQPPTTPEAPITSRPSTPTTRSTTTTTTQRTTTTRRTTTTQRVTTSVAPSTNPPPPSGGGGNSGSWVKVGDENAHYSERIIPTTHHFFNPFSANAPSGWGESRIGFLVHCEPVMVKQIDPIVSPGGTSGHMHEFFGNPGVTANSTTQSLIDVPTSRIDCTDKNDKSAYWTPTAFQNGKQVTADHFKAYYKSPASNTQPMPLGLRMIAGDATANKNQSRQVGWWQSTDSVNTINKNAMISRQGSAKLTLRMNFPDCWDGKHLDSPNHKSHMAYSSGKGCPSSHPVRVPQLVTFTDYVTNGGGGFSLSSGEWYTFHQDFWNGWAPAQMEALNRRCGQASMNCRARKSPDLVPRGQYSAVVAGS